MSCFVSCVVVDIMPVKWKQGRVSQRVQLTVDHDSTYQRSVLDSIYLKSKWKG